jgi:hypothetical protein
LPPDPYEGALLGWLNNELAWIGTPPVPIPPGVFGPITDWNSESGILEVAGEIPPDVANGVYLYQCEADGTLYMNGFDTSQFWSGYGTGTPYQPDRNWNKAFNPIAGDPDQVSMASAADPLTWEYEIPVVDQVTFYCLNQTSRDGYGLNVNDNLWFEGTSSYDSQIHASAAELGGSLRKIKLITSGNVGAYLSRVVVDGKILVDPEWSLQMRVNQVMDQMIIGSVVNDYAQFEVGKYLKIPAQRVAPWVLYGNDPTSLIDHLRSS